MCCLVLPSPIWSSVPRVSSVRHLFVCESNHVRCELMALHFFSRYSSMTFRTVNSSLRNKVKRGVFTLMTTIGIVSVGVFFFSPVTCISGYVKVWLECV